MGDGSDAGFRFAGTLQVGAEHQVTLRDDDLAELGLLTTIFSSGRLIAAGGVEVDSDEKLAGSGAVSGDIVVREGGQVSPGTSPGMVSTDTGNLELQLGGDLRCRGQQAAAGNGPAAGTNYDQIDVQGTVSVDGAVLVLNGGQFQPGVGTVFTLIANDGSDPVFGRFVNAAGQTLDDGAIVRFGGIEARLSYGGTLDNNVTLTVTDQLRFVRTTSTESGTTTTILVGIARTAERQLLLQRPLTATQFFLTESAAAAASDSGLDEQHVAAEFRSAQRLRVFFRVVNEGTGVEDAQAHDLDPDLALRDVLGIFKRLPFPNGRYRLYLQEPGKRERLIVEVNIVDGKIVPQNFRETESPGATAAPQPACAAHGAARRPLRLHCPARTLNCRRRWSFPQIALGRWRSSWPIPVRPRRCPRDRSLPPPRAETGPLPPCWPPDWPR